MSTTGALDTYTGIDLTAVLSVGTCVHSTPFRVHVDLSSTGFVIFLVCSW